jgi:hypothetical protein
MLSDYPPSMNTLDALAALRELDVLAEPRRRHLCMLAADAPTDAERARLVFQARHEARQVRAQAEAALKAELAERARWAEDHAERPVEGPLRPSRRGQLIGAEEGTTHAGPRPVVVTYGPITRTATEKQKQERKPLMGANRKYPSAPAPEVKVKAPRPLKHGLASTYNHHGCRCDECRAAKALSRKGIGRVRRANGEPAPHGTTTSYSRGCRCQPCRDAVAAHARMKYAEKRSGFSPQ